MWAGTFPRAGRAFAPAYHRFGVSGTPEWASVRGTSIATIGPQAVATLTTTFWRRSCPRPGGRVCPEVFRQLGIERVPGNARSAPAKDSVYQGVAVLAVVPQWQENV